MHRCAGKGVWWSVPPYSLTTALVAQLPITGERSCSKQPIRPLVGLPMLPVNGLPCCRTGCLMAPPGATPALREDSLSPHRALAGRTRCPRRQCIALDICPIP